MLEDAIELFKRMGDMDKTVAKKLNEEHDRRVSLINQNRKEKSIFEQRTRSRSRGQRASQHGW